MQKIKQKDYERASQLLGRLFEVDTDITERINTEIQHNGIRVFFKNIDAYDFPKEVCQHTQTSKAGNDQSCFECSKSK